jgi:hypothetical protein
MSSEVIFNSYTREDIFDLCYPKFSTLSEPEQTSTEVMFDEALASLLLDGLATRSVDVDGNELITPTGRPMVEADEYVGMSKIAIDSIQLQKSILGCLTLKKSLFNAIILYCQFDKSNQQGRYILNAIKKALTDMRYLPVIFVVGDNLSNLMDQTIAGFKELLCRELGIEGGEYEGLMCLKSGEGIRQQDIEHYIDSYYLSYLTGSPEKKLPPIIMALNNKTQLKKLIDIHQKKIVAPIQRGSTSPLRSVFVFDEFDKVYRSLRPTFKPYLVDSPTGVISVLGVTGSEDGICDEFPEWASANLVRVELNEEKERNHRGIHHTDAVINRQKQTNSVGNSSYALNIIKSNLPKFTELRTNPKNGTTYYPKTLILGDSRLVGQRTLATQLLAYGHVILQNENNLKVRRTDGSSDWIPRSIRKRVLRDVLYETFNELKLWDKPVFLIGNKKLDRGLGYHYAPPAGGRGLIWTDEIMGNIQGGASRIQKVSRIHGVIAQCEDYPNQLIFWIDERTEVTVRNENGIIKSLHDNYRGFHSLGERLDYARKVTPQLKKSRKYLISESFATQAQAEAWFDAEKARLAMLPDYGCSAFGLYLDSSVEGSPPVGEGTPGITKIRYRGDFMPIMTESVLRETDDDIGQGANTSARIMPVFVEGVIRFVVIYIVKASVTSVDGNLRNVIIDAPDQ